MSKKPISIQRKLWNTFLSELTEEAQKEINETKAFQEMSEEDLDDLLNTAFSVSWKTFERRNKQWKRKRKKKIIQTQ